MANQLIDYPGIHTSVGLTTAQEYLEAARELKEFSLIVGHYKLADYKSAEAELADENIFPQRRIICTASASAPLLQWASEQFYDGVIDLTDFRNTFGIDAMELLTAEKGQGHASVSFPLTTNVPAFIPYRDDIDESIVRLISYGFNNQEIAESVFLSIQTVRNRISRLLETSGARNRTHLSTMYLLPFASFENGEVHPTLPMGNDLPIERTDLSASDE